MKISPRFKIQYPMKNHTQDTLFLRSAAYTCQKIVTFNCAFYGNGAF